MTLQKYRKSVRWLQVFVLASPFITKLFDRHSQFPFPPLGDKVDSWRFVAFLIIGSAFIVPYFFRPFMRPDIAMSTLFCVMIVVACMYLYANNLYVVTITDALGKKNFVIRGGDRNPDLKEPYRSMSDYDLIQHSGTRDEYLEQAYTASSISWNRWKVFVPYLGALVAFELFLGFAVKNEDQVG
jgi:hypothetical protein